MTHGGQRVTSVCVSFFGRRAFKTLTRARDIRIASVMSKETVARVYNKFLIDMVLQLKAVSPGLKRALKAAGHKAIDPTSASYIAHAAERLPLDVLLSVPVADVMKNAGALAFEPLSGVSFAHAVTAGDGTEDAPEDSTKTSVVARTYLYILAVLCETYTQASPDGNTEDALVSNVLEVLARIQTDGDCDDAIDGILDDNVVALLERTGEAVTLAKSEPSVVDGEGGGMDDILKSLENSKIADLAKEISSEIDLSQLSAPGQNPEDFLNFANLTDSNSVLGNIVSKVGSKIQGKLSSGELRHDELLSEAVSLIKAFEAGTSSGGGGAGGNPLISEMLNMAKSGKLNGLLGAAAAGGGGGAAGGLGALFGGGNNNNNKPKVSARERLRRKLEAKQQKA